MIKSSIRHLKDNDMTYRQHFMFAVGHGLKCIKAGLLLVCHGIIPSIFQQAGSRLVYKLNKSFTEKG